MSWAKDNFARPIPNAIRTRRAARLLVAFSCALSPLLRQPVAAQLTTQPNPETIVAAQKRLTAIKPAKRSHNEHALLAALDFALAVGRVEGKRAATVIDAVGYQSLPLAGDLPEKPDKPLPRAAIEKSIGDRKPAEVDKLTLNEFEVVTRDHLRSRFPAIATWMLAEDRAVVLRPPPAGSPPTHWLGREACIVVRIRAEKATIIGGNLLEALASVPGSLIPEGEEK